MGRDPKFGVHIPFNPNIVPPYTPVLPRSNSTHPNSQNPVNLEHLTVCHWGLRGQSMCTLKPVPLGNRGRWLDQRQQGVVGPGAKWEGVPPTKWLHVQMFPKQQFLPD